MSTFAQKLRTVTLGTVHDLLDKAIDLNSPSALRQHVRDIEHALDKMRDNAAVQAGQVRTLDREIGDTRSRVATDKAVIERILEGQSPVKEELARAKAIAVIRLEKQASDLEDQAQLQRQTSTAIDQAVADLAARHEKSIARLRDLERLDRDSKAKEQAAHSLRSAEAMLTGGAEIGVDDIERKVRARNDVANEALQRALGSLSPTVDEGMASAVDDLLSELRPKALTA